MKRKETKRNKKKQKDPEITREKSMQAFMSLRVQSKKNFLHGMSLEEINSEIGKARRSDGDEE